MSLLLIWQKQGSQDGTATGVVAAVTVGTNDATVSLAPSASLATVTAAASSATSKVAPTGVVAAVTAVANSGSESVAPTAGTAPVVLVANTAAETDSPAGTTAAVAVAALDATVSAAGGTTNAAGTTAAVTVVIPGAFDLGGFDPDGFDIPAHVVAVDGGVVPVVTPPRRHGGKPLNAATVSGPAGRRVRHVRARAQLATVTVRAYDATTHWNDDDFAILLLLEAA